MWVAARSDLTLSIFLMAFRVFSARFRSYLSGLFRFLSNSKVESFSEEGNEQKDKHGEESEEFNFWIQRWKQLKTRVKVTGVPSPGSCPFHAIFYRPWSILLCEGSSSFWSSCGTWICKIEKSAKKGLTIENLMHNFVKWQYDRLDQWYKSETRRSCQAKFHSTNNPTHY